MSGAAPGPTRFPYTTLFRSRRDDVAVMQQVTVGLQRVVGRRDSLGEARQHRLEGLDPPSNGGQRAIRGQARSEEHTSELQSHSDLVCRLLLEKKKPRQPHHE